MEEKIFKTHNEMLDILEKRGIDLSTPALRGMAKRSLQHEGYYNLINGYKTLFLEKDDDDQFIFPDRYKAGTTVDEIYYVCCFDKKLRSIFLRNILHIETNIKTLIAYTFSKHHGHKNFLIYDNFDTTQKDATKNITKLISDIQKLISDRITDPSITHYVKNHGYVPLWVLNNVLTLGTISKFYSLMKQPERQEVAKILGVQDNQLSSVLTYLSSLRNICAHGNRSYCFRTTRPITDFDTHSHLNIPRDDHNEFTYGKRDLFAAMIIFKNLLSHNEFLTAIKQINKELMDLKSKLKVLSEEDILECMGFPVDWRQQLLSLPR